MTSISQVSSSSIPDPLPLLKNKVELSDIVTRLESLRSQHEAHLGIAPMQRIDFDKNLSGSNIIIHVNDRTYQLPGGWKAYADKGWLPPQSFINDILSPQTPFHINRRDYRGLAGFLDRKVSKEFFQLFVANADRTPMHDCNSYRIGFLFGITLPDNSYYIIDGHGMENDLHFGRATLAKFGSIVQDGQNITHAFWDRVEALSTIALSNESQEEIVLNELGSSNLVRSQRAIDNSEYLIKDPEEEALIQSLRKNIDQLRKDPCLLSLHMRPVISVNQEQALKKGIEIAECEAAHAIAYRRDAFKSSEVEVYYPEERFIQAMRKVATSLNAQTLITQPPELGAFNQYNFYYSTFRTRGYVIISSMDELAQFNYYDAKLIKRIGNVYVATISPSFNERQTLENLDEIKLSGINPSENAQFGVHTLHPGTQNCAFCLEFSDLSTMVEAIESLVNQEIVTPHQLFVEGSLLYVYGNPNLDQVQKIAEPANLIPIESIVEKRKRDKVKFIGVEKLHRVCRAYSETER
jgi:hypothetical protein